MTTGRIGRSNSELGSIVPGIADSFGIGTFGFYVHVISSRSVRIIFSSEVTESALTLEYYSIISLASPGSAIVPSLESVRFFDDTHSSVVLNYDRSLTYNTLYSLQLVGILNLLGEGITSNAQNFSANVQAPAHVSGAYQSKRGCVDIVFDRPVGPTSTSATANIRDSSGGPGVAMTLLDWASESNLPSNFLRFSIPLLTPSANEFSIDFDNVVDESLNVSSGTVELELALRSPPPYDYTSLTQLQIIDAYVSDVSNDLINTGTVRVYFNCPTSDAFDYTLWTGSISGPHANVDIADVLTAPDAFDLSSLIVLCNDIKSNFNLHVNESIVHALSDPSDIITVPDATDLSSSETLLNSIQTKFLAHIRKSIVHTYSDFYSSFTFILVSGGSLPLAMAVANEIKVAYNTHISSSRSLTFSTQYPSPLGRIVVHSTIDNSMPADSKFTYYVELHFTLNSNLVDVDLGATLTSEDGFSFTNPSDYTGSITARSTSSPAVPVSDFVTIDESVLISFDKELIVENDSIVQIQDSGGKLVKTGPHSLSTSLPFIIWSLNQLMFSYTYHISAFTAINAGHQNQDTDNIIFASDYITSSDLATVINSANYFRNLLNSHVSNGIFHFQSDFNQITGPVAFDFDSLVDLVGRIRKVFLSHNKRLGPHEYPGWRIYSAPLNNSLFINFDLMVDTADYSIIGGIKDYYHNNDGDLLTGSTSRKSGTDLPGYLQLNVGFEGVASRPSLASVVPVSGLMNINSNESLASDSIQLFFSKNMYQNELDVSDFSVSGGSLNIENPVWMGPRMVSINISSMISAVYSIQALGLADEAGNPIYP